MRGWHRLLEKRLAPLLALLLFILLGASPVSAHAQLVRASPGPGASLPFSPSRVQLEFDESVDPLFSEVQVLNTARKRLDAGQIASVPSDPQSLVIPLSSLPDGAYTVVWKAFSATDGHITRGLYSFTVGQPVAGANALPMPDQGEENQTSPLGFLARGATLIGLLVLVGGFFFRIILLDRSLQAVGARPELMDAPWRSLEAAALALAFSGSILELGLEVRLVGEQISLQPVAEVMFGTRWGALWLVRTFLLVASGTILLVRTPRARIAIPSVSLLSVLSLYLVANSLSLTRGLFLASLLTPQGSSVSQQVYLYVHHFGLILPFLLFFGAAFFQRFRLFGLLPLLGILALSTLALSGHGAAAEGDFSLASLSDWLHLIAVSAWVGGLVHFAWAMRSVRGAMEPQRYGKWMAWLLPKFSLLAIVATILIALTGFYNSLVEIPALSRLLQFGMPALLPSDLPYTYTLIAKVVLFCAMLAFGALNLFWLSPRFRRHVLEPQAGGRFLNPLRLTIAGEILLGLTVILIAGLLTLEPPARGQSAFVYREVAGTAVPSPLVLSRDATSDVRVRMSVAGDWSSAEAAEVRRANELDVQVTDANGKPVADIMRVIISLSYLDSDTGVQRKDAEPRGDGNYSLAGNILPLAGQWQVRAIVRRRGVDDVTADFAVNVLPETR